MVDMYGAKINPSDWVIYNGLSGKRYLGKFRDPGFDFVTVAPNAGRTIYYSYSNRFEKATDSEILLYRLEE